LSAAFLKSGLELKLLLGVMGLLGKPLGDFCRLLKEATPRFNETALNALLRFTGCFGPLLPSDFYLSSLHFRLKIKTLHVQATFVRSLVKQLFMMYSINLKARKA
jgi:hypothetical protein